MVLFAGGGLTVTAQGLWSLLQLQYMTKVIMDPLCVFLYFFVTLLFVLVYFLLLPSPNNTHTFTYVGTKTDPSIQDKEKIKQKGMISNLNSFFFL